MICGISTAVSLTAAEAKDFYLKPTQSGQVAGTPLAAISLQANNNSGTTRTRSYYRNRWLARQRARNGGGEEGTTSSGQTTSPTPSSTPAQSTEQLKGSTDSGTSGGAKFVSAPKTGGDGGTTTTPTTTPSPTPTPTPAPAPMPSPTPTPTPTPAPAPGQSTNPPAAGQTFANFNALAQSGQLSGGDRVFLLDGYHGPLSVTDLKVSSPITIATMPGETAHVDSITVRNSSNFVFKDLKVWATSPNAGTGALVRSYATSSNLAFIDLDVRSVANAGNYAQWTGTDWKNNQRIGFQVEGNANTVARNRVTGLFHGILALGANALVEENIVDGFGGDGMRALGDNSVVRRNKVQNCFQWNSNHADAFQSFSRGANGKTGTGVVKNLTIEGNKFFEWTLASTNPLRCKLQGIGMFDGMFDGITIRNNVISSRAYHGITIAGALNTKVVNNTVVNSGGTAPGYPWIRIAAHKNGTTSQNTTVANNMASGIKVNPDTTRKIVETNNFVVKNAAAEFVSPGQHNFALQSSSKGVDAGAPGLAPTVDIAGAKRPKGKAPDAGAYESF
ncbi:right-handed parallel beta-helix repeat-containing protein [Albidovulum aquaemixtae]|nr:right-handed parallel beta-helix repeat-containing protein [Defluviimonas aquaemixtae]